MMVVAKKSVEWGFFLTHRGELLSSSSRKTISKPVLLFFLVFLLFLVL